MSTELSICNTALLLVNANKINSFDDETREAQICDALYETTKDSLLQKYPWSFSLFQELLAQTANTPLFDFSHEYQLPTGFLRILKKDNSSNNYRILKDKLFTDDDPVEILYQKDPGVAFYSAFFVRTLELKMAELLSMSLVNDENIAQLFNRSYINSMREARAIDSQNTPTQLIPQEEFSLTAVRGYDD